MILTTITNLSHGLSSLLTSVRSIIFKINLLPLCGGGVHSVDMVFDTDSWVPIMLLVPVDLQYYCTTWSNFINLHLLGLLIPQLEWVISIF